MASPELDANKFISIDCGLENFIAIFNPNGKNYIVKGRNLKSINQYYNKRKGLLQSTYEKQKVNINTKRFIRISQGRKNRINDIFNKTVDFIVKLCVKEKIGTVVIGDFSGSKQNINLGRTNNQNFDYVDFSTKTDLFILHNLKIPITSKLSKYQILSSYAVFIIDNIKFL